MRALAKLRGWIDRDPGAALLVLALVIACAIYAPTLPRGLTNYDDPWLVEHNTALRDCSLSTLHKIFFELDTTSRLALGAEYLPIRDVSVMVDFALWGDWFPGHHAVNLATYLAAIALWFAALAKLGLDRRLVGLAMLLYALHPTHAESVAWITERKGLLGLAFAGAAADGYARFRAGGRARDLIVAAIAAAFAVWSKAPAAFAVGALAPLELVLPGRVSWRRSLVGLAVVGGCAAAAFVPVLLTASNLAVVSASARSDGRLALVLGAHGLYLQLATMVIANAIAYPLATHGPSAAQIVVGALGLVAIVAAAALPAKSPPRIALRAGAWLWLFGWLPVSHLVLPVQTVVIADRYALQSTLGFALIVAVAISLVPTPRLRNALAVVVVLASALRSFDAQSQWASPRALWGRAVESDPDNASARSQYAEALANDGDPIDALAVTREGLALAPDAPPAVLELREALLLRSLGDPAGSLAAMQRAARDGEPKAMSNLALIELDAGHVETALEWAQRGVVAVPLASHAQRTLGKVALAAHRNDVALAAFQRAYELEPGFVGNRFNLALALIAVGRGADARPHLEACLADPQLGPRARDELSRLPP